MRGLYLPTRSHFRVAIAGSAFRSPGLCGTASEGVRDLTSLRSEGLAKDARYSVHRVAEAKAGSNVHGRTHSHIAWHRL